MENAIFRIFLGLLFVVQPVYCKSQNDSVMARSLEEIGMIQDSTVRVLAVGFKLPKDFDYNDIPFGLNKLMLLKGSRNLVSYGALLPRVESVEEIWLSYETIKFLPDILDIGGKIKYIHLSQGTLEDVFTNGGFLYGHQVKRLTLMNVEIDDNCELYKNLFLSERLHVNELFYNGSELDPESVGLIRQIFKPDRLYINGMLINFP